VRVICSFEEDVFFLAKCLKDQSDIEIITEKDYISHPRRMRRSLTSLSRPTETSNKVRAFHVIFDTLCYDMQ
jgi:ppGpp synthetase/RelA/SpoT-type nucleotidyltranferase